MVKNSFETIALVSVWSNFGTTAISQVSTYNNKWWRGVLPHSIITIKNGHISQTIGGYVELKVKCQFAIARLML